MKKSLLVLALSLSLFVGYGQTAFVKDFTGPFSRNEDQILALAEAFPQDKYDWAPDEGVRSVKEVLLHTASANYYFISSMGFELPKGVDLAAIDGLSSKEEIIAVVKSSMNFVKEKSGTLTEKNLNEKFKLPFGEFTKRTAILILLDHSGEHKGQLIAYARMNKITPPWSEEEK